MMPLYRTIWPFAKVLMSLAILVGFLLSPDSWTDTLMALGLVTVLAFP